MATKNISELVKRVKENTDLSEYYQKYFKELLGGDYNLYGYTYIGEYKGESAFADLVLMARGVADIDKSIALAWEQTDIKPEQETWLKLANYCIIYVTDKNGNIIKETPRRYF